MVPRGVTCRLRTPLIPLIHVARRCVSFTSRIDIVHQYIPYGRSMNLNFNFPDLVADPSYSFAPTGTVLPSFRPSAFTNTAEGSRDDDARRYDVELRRVLAGQTEGLEVQEERVYRAEVSVEMAFETESTTPKVNHKLTLWLLVGEYPRFREHVLASPGTKTDTSRSRNRTEQSKSLTTNTHETQSHHSVFLLLSASHLRYQMATQRKEDKKTIKRT